MIYGTGHSQRVIGSQNYLLALFSLLFFWDMALSIMPLPAVAQGSNFSQMEKMLDQVDRPGSWPQPSANTGANTGENTGQFNQKYSAGSRAQSGAVTPHPASLFTPRNILRALLDAPPEGTKSGGFGSARGSVQENLQTARNEASRARAACAEASSGSDREARMAAAERARYAAQAAREAADRATSKAANTTGDIQDLAAQARAEADQAQESADRATGNAEGGGW
jgi:hypothetical protein